MRDYSESESEYITNSNNRVITYFDKEIKERMFEGDTWKKITDEIVKHLPDKVYISFDIDGLDPKLCPNTGTPVQGGFEQSKYSIFLKNIAERQRANRLRPQ